MGKDSFAEEPVQDVKVVSKHKTILHLQSEMKRITVILLMFLYLLPTTGIVVSLHYCGDSIASVSFNPFHTKHKCSCGSKKMAKDCCKDKTTIIKLDNEQKNTQQVLCTIVKEKNFQPAISTKIIVDYHAPLLSDVFNHNTHPPDEIKHPLYIQHRTFRI